jgi:ubiquinone/menaquinone biosynthesis C-methylase UbiE
MTVFEPGCAKGFFTLPLARMVGPLGKVICSDVQPKMLERLAHRARKTGLADRIDVRLCTQEDLGLGDSKEEIDCIAALHVVHEMSDQATAFGQMYDALKPGGRLLLLEPVRHVSAASFRASLDHACLAGFAELPAPSIRRGQIALLEKP